MKNKPENEPPKNPPKPPETKEIGGYKGQEPTEFGDWQHKGRVTDF